MERIYHPWHKWECYKAGLYSGSPPQGMNSDEAKEAYAVFLADHSRFEAALSKVIAQWHFSCEHFLSNTDINRIAWLGQSSMCLATGVPARFRAGFKLLSGTQQKAANQQAENALARWARRYEHANKNITIYTQMAQPGLFDRHTGHGAARINAT